ncbi:MAG: hypothetical protein RSC93_10275 [Erysipelotrichaceae bacterium]
MEWIISANHNIYNHNKAFEELPYIDWKQNANYQIGDKIYIYATKPIKAIEYLTEVIAINFNQSEIINDSKYWVDTDEYNKGIKNGKYVRLKLIKKLDACNLTLEKLHEYGMTGNIQGPRKLIDDLGNYYPWGSYIIETLSKRMQEYEKWSDFVEFAFKKEEFCKSFHKYNTLNRSYYDLFFDSKEVHLVARNTATHKSLEVYIENNASLYNFILRHFDMLSYKINENMDLYPIAETNNLKHRKFIIHYDEKSNIPFNQWLLDNALTLKKNIKQLEKKYNNKLNFHILLEDNAVNNSISNLNVFPDSFEYCDELLLAPEKIIKNNISTYKRSRQKSINAIVHANFHCEMDNTHHTFIRKKCNFPYTEAHHLIPLTYQDQFEYSLDIEENIISLCSNCHNEIHYGINAHKLIEKLYNERKELLRKKNIDIKLDKLLSFYGY